MNNGIKQDQLKPCAMCHLGVMHTRGITFYRVRIERMVIDLNAVRQQDGLERMLGNAHLAFAMGANADLAKPLGKANEALICDECAMQRQCLAAIDEQISEGKMDAELVKEESHG